MGYNNLMPSKNKYATTKDLIKSVCKKTKFPQETVQNVIDAYISLLQTSLLENTKVRLNEFGTFETTNWQSRETFDINLGKKVSREIKTILFKPSQSLKDKI
jgi:nucleoid DNA-binding protein